MYNYEECLKTCMTQIKKYQQLRRNEEHWDYDRFQEIRDELNEALVSFGPYFAEARAASDQAQWDRKLHYESRKNHWRKHYEGKRGFASTIESNSLLDCKDIIEKEVNADRHYQKCRQLVERVDQMINSIAGRCKGLLKDWGD